MSSATDSADDRIATLALARLSLPEIEQLLLQLFGETEVPPTAETSSLAMRAVTMLAGRLACARRQAVDEATQTLAAKALARLRGQVAARYRAMAEEAPVSDEQAEPPGDLAFLIRAYRVHLQRGVHPQELDDWAVRMREGPLDRSDVDATLRRVAADQAPHARQATDTSACWIMGTRQTIAPEDWQRRARTLTGAWQAPTSLAPSDRIQLRGEPRCLVTAIASLYRGGEFIEAFMENISKQSVFRDWCELIVIDAASPEGEAETIRRYMADFPNIRYIRSPDCIGIYQAWNIGVREARGEFITNTNLDDLRRTDSFALQAATLQRFPEVDVVYQDIYYALQPHLSFDQAAAFGFRSRVPLVTPKVMLEFNPPHNAPMWRRRLHDELGPFDERYRSAGDYEFWLRCLAEGKQFHRIADAHVVYYQNPHGISTRADSPGRVETREITARYAERLLGAGAGSGEGTIPAPDRVMCSAASPAVA